MADYAVENVQLRLMYELGEDDKGNLLFRSKNYNNIKVDAEATITSSRSNFWPSGNTCIKC
ncbi:DUF1659 domain-containing protein [Sutcliffiella horikoshii]|uniref:DUF1659 domain-containing protein n=1 Tax=Sutcliffiella horikoshii TaxID=79883 RepID=UPI00384E5303